MRSLIPTPFVAPIKMVFCVLYLIFYCNMRAINITIIIGAMPTIIDVGGILAPVKNKSGICQLPLSRGICEGCCAPCALG